MLHLVNHALAKGAMFLLAGRVLHRYRTTDIARVSRPAPIDARDRLAVPGRQPGRWSACRPFGLFISEFALLRAGFAAGRPWLMGIVLVLSDGRRRRVRRAREPDAVRHGAAQGVASGRGATGDWRAGSRCAWGRSSSSA